ncbi:uncharacterized protein LOC133366825 [Rhineura floridana]|uniref:uncharacterized protein LOC133366825 n=1 Tax=Rhineura floridana TaxID=261503 RepID=UPI002AC8174A|nr:uncharacterized protein LOC133366825 [Rhineura floridana]
MFRVTSVMLRSKSESPASPSVFSLMSCCNFNNGGHEEDISLACLLEENFPGSATITWEPNGPAKKYPGELRKGSNKVFSISQLSVSPSDFKAKPYKCLVQPKTGRDPISATFDYKHCISEPPKPVQVQILTPNCGEQATESTLELVCFLRSLGPGKATVEWLKNGEGEQGKVEATLRRDQEKSHGYSSFVRRNVSKQSWDKGDVYTCKVSRPPSSQNVAMYNTSNCHACYDSRRQPTISIINPSYRDLLEGTASITCFVTGSNLENVQVTWDVNGRPSTGGQAEMGKKAAEGIQTMKHTFPVSLEQWRKGTSFTCKVAGSCYKELTKGVTIQKDAQTMKPSVTISRANLDISANSTKALILVCDVSGFSPEEISISWKKDNLPLNAALYDNGPVTPDGNAHATYSILKIGRDAAGGKGGSYSCVVHHSSSDKPLSASEKVPFDLPVPVKVDTIPPSFADVYQTKLAKLTCRISNILFDQDLQGLNITWTRASDDTPLETVLGKPMEQESSELVFVDAVATVYADDWDRGEAFICKIIHPDLFPSNPEVKFLSKPQDGIPSAPQVYILPPPSDQLALQETATITCLLKRFYPSDIFVKWLQNDKPVDASKYLTNKPLQESKTPELYYTYSTLTINEQDWSSGSTFTCLVGHETLPFQTTQKTIDKNTAGVHLSFMDGIVDSDDYEELQNISSILSTFIILFLVSLFYSATVTAFKVKYMGQKDSQRETDCGTAADVCLLQSISSLGFEPLKAPAVFPLSPCYQDLSTASQVSMGCLVAGYFPEPVTVQWNSGANGIQTFPPLFDSSSGHYTLSSQLTVPVSKWKSDKFQCKVTHKAASSGIIKDIASCETLPEPKAPEVRLLHSSCKPRSSDATMELVCFITGFYPSEVIVEWLVGGKSGLLPSFTEPPRKDASSYTFSTMSTANISQADWMEGNVIHCQVSHKATQTKVKSKAKKCEDDSSRQCASISVYTLPPTPKDLYINRDPKVTCVVNNLDSADGLKVSWTRERSGPVQPDLLDVAEQFNGTYTAISTLPVTSWLDREEFTCKVESPSLPVPITKTIAKKTGKMAAPNVYLFPPHQEQISAQSAELFVICMIDSFSPVDVNVQWLKNHNALPEDQYVNTPVMKDKTKNAYFLYSRLSVDASEWDSHTSYTCMVVHEALSMKFTQRTVEKSQGKK